MPSLTFLFSKAPDSNPNPNPNRGSDRLIDATDDGSASISTGHEETVAGTTADDAAAAAAAGTTTSSTPAASGAEGERRRALMETPPTDDVCPICFCNFVVPCRAPCGHWYCGSCILQYWNFSAALQPCKCPMCSQYITKLIPEASLYQRHEVEIRKVLMSVADYNRLFAGGISGFMLKVFAIPLSLKRMFREMLNPDRPGIYLHEMRLIAMFLGVLCSFFPFDFLQIGRHNIINMLDYCALGLSFVLYMVGLYIRWKRQRNVRELVGLEPGDD